MAAIDAALLDLHLSNDAEDVFGSMDHFVFEVRDQHDDEFKGVTINLAKAG